MGARLQKTGGTGAGQPRILRLQPARDSAGVEATRTRHSGACADNDCLVLGGTRFLGSTLWTDFLAAGSGAAQQEAMLQSRQFNRDFSRIRAEPGTEGRLFTPQDCAALFACNAQWLRAQLALPFAGPTVVVTHHAPSLRSVPARFAGSPLNPNFVSDAEQLLAGGHARLWVHGPLARSSTLRKTEKLS